MSPATIININKIIYKNKEPKALKEFIENQDISEIRCHKTANLWKNKNNEKDKFAINQCDRARFIRRQKLYQDSSRLLFKPARCP